MSSTSNSWVLTSRVAVVMANHHFHKVDFQRSSRTALTMATRPRASHGDTLILDDSERRFCEQLSGAAAQPPKRGGEIRRRDLFHRSTASENRRDFAHSEFLRDRLKKNSKQCSSLAKLKRKRRSYQVEAEERLRYRDHAGRPALGPNTWRAFPL